MASDPTTPGDELEQRATAFLFGELDRDQAAEFRKQLEASSDLQATVASIREAVTALESEFTAGTAGVNDRDRRRINQAIGSRPPSPPPPVVDPTTESNHRWVIVLATAASLLLVCGLTLPTLNRAMTAGRVTDELREKIAKIERENDRLRKENRAAQERFQTIGKPPKSERFDAAMVEAKQLRTQPSAAPRSGGQASTAGPTKQEFKQPTGQATSPGLPELSYEVPSAGGEPESMDRRMMGMDDMMKGGMMMGGEMYEMEMSPMEGAMSGPASKLDGETTTDKAFYDAPSLQTPSLQTPPELAQNIVPKEPLAKTVGDDLTPLSTTLEGIGRLKRGVAGPRQSGDRFESIIDNPFRSVTEAPLSTFSIDVDTAAYAKVRMDLLQSGRLPDPDAVRIEEMINYFDYEYAPPAAGDEPPFSAAMDIVGCPWNPDHRLARIGIKGKMVDQQRPASNLVFLLDVSGSMNRPNKLPLVISGMKMLVNQLDERDSVAIVVYSGAAGLVLDSTSGDRKKAIYDALDRLRAGGSTNGGQGIQLAYTIARDHFIDGGTNRVILCSDGDFNVGVTGTDQLVQMASKNAKDDIFLSVLGFGSGNHNDAMMEQISNRGNGNYAFIDTEDEARKVFVDQMQGTLVTIAKDVKVQVEFNPLQVRSYRLIGYANRMLAAQDFNDDTKDAGEIGAGHTVTALYEIVSAGTSGRHGDRPVVDELKYQRGAVLSELAESGEALTLKLRYKPPTGDRSTLIEFPVKDDGRPFERADQDFQFAAAVAAFGMLLRDSRYKGGASYDMAAEIAASAADGDRSGYRDEFVSLIGKAKQLAGR